MILHRHSLHGSRLESQEFSLAAFHLDALVITLDRPGYGGTSDIRDPDVFEAVEDVKALIKHLELQDVYLLGTCGGNRYAVATAEALPVSQVRTLALVGENLRLSATARDLYEMHPMYRKKHEDHLALWYRLIGNNPPQMVKIGKRWAEKCDIKRVNLKHLESVVRAEGTCLETEGWRLHTALSAEEQEMQEDLYQESYKQAFLGHARDVQETLSDTMEVQAFNNGKPPFKLPLEKVTLHSSSDVTDASAYLVDYKRVLKDQYGVAETVYPAARYWNLLQTEAYPILKALLAIGGH